MALLRCPDCGKEYSSRLDACPKCGSPASYGMPVADNPFPDPADPDATLRGWLEGMRLKEKYELVKMLGRGAFGEVWKAKDLEAEVFVALKLLPQEMSGSPAEIVRVRKNFQQVHALHHQHIVAHLAMFQDGMDCALVMELVDGLTLEEYRFDYEEKHGDFPLDEALRICRQIAEGLDFAHSRGVAHRDVKPANVMITGRGEVKLLDFGLAAEIRSSMSRVSKQMFDTSGTRPYMAPEQWQGRAPGAASDQYALGAVLYELLAGHPPFESDDPAVLRECVLRETPETLASLTSQQNDALLRSQSKKPGDRFPNCLAFVEALEHPAGDTAAAQKTKEQAQLLKPVVEEPTDRQAHEKEMQAWVNEQPIKLGEKLAGDFNVNGDYRIGKGSSLMSFAAVQGRVDVMEWLKANGEDVNVKSDHCDTPMHLSASGGHVSAMEWLKWNGADVNAKTYGGHTPLDFVFSSSEKAKRWLQENGGMSGKDF